MQLYIQSTSDLLSDGKDTITDQDIEESLASEKGHFDRLDSLISDEDFQLSARTYVRSNACKKGEPNLTTGMFAVWVKQKYDHDISEETARLWLHKLGFGRTHHQKGVYFDGHERQDVVQHRSEFLSNLLELDKITITPSNLTPLCPEGVKPLIRVVHDESTYYANCDQSYFWGDEHTNVLKQKSLGQSIMVSDFIDNVNGFLQFNDSKARVMIEVHKDGYFNNEELMKQVEKAVDIFELKYPHARGLFLFDNAPSHRKIADNQLNVDKMNVSSGGKQPVMRDTVWNGNVQRMVLDDGRPKGMKIILKERGVDTHGMNAEKMREKLNTYEDFKIQKTILEEYVEQRGHLCLYYPKYHCELSPIERVWCHSKKHTRAYANGTITRLRKIVPEGLETCTSDMISKYFTTCMDYEQAYRDGCLGKDVEVRVKVYKSHRKVTNDSS